MSMSIYENVTPRVLRDPTPIEGRNIGEKLARVGQLAIESIRLARDVWNGDATIGLNAANGTLLEPSKPSAASQRHGEE